MSKKGKKTLPIGWIVGLLIVIGLFVPIIDVPYTTTENYRELVPYTETAPLKYQTIDDLSWVSHEAQTVLKNTDDVEGTYHINFVLWNNDTGKRYTPTKSITLMPGEVGTVVVDKWSISQELGYGEYYGRATILPGDKTIQKTRYETKTRQVTRETKVSLIRYILGI